MGKGASKVLQTVTHPIEEIASELISHTRDIPTTVNAVTTAALHHASSTRPVVHTAHIDSITVSKLPTITGQPGAVVSHQTFPTYPPLQPPVIHRGPLSSTKAELTFVEKLEASVQDTTVLASAAAGAAGGLALGGDNRALAMIVGGISPILAHALLAK